MFFFMFNDRLTATLQARLVVRLLQNFSGRSPLRDWRYLFRFNRGALSKIINGRSWPVYLSEQVAIEDKVNVIQG
ncbi:MAG: hypothetical protein ACO3ZG_02420 [Kiritimatiellia bacterium]